jgi:glutamate synthase domain-containing protein 2
MEGLAMALRFATDMSLDLLTIDGSAGGTGMSPWNMMEYWGVPSLVLHAKAREYASILEKQGKRVVDLSFAGGLAREDHIFKALAVGAPYVKSVCMGRALMIPGFLGSNIEGVIRPDRKAAVNGLWDKLPLSVTEHGSYPEEIFTCYYDVQDRVGADEMNNIPYGAIALWTLVDKLGAGLQQLMAGARRFSIPEISRVDLFSGNRETETETGIPFLTEAGNDRAIDILTV